MDSGTSCLPEWLVFTAKYLVNFVPSAGSLVFMFLYLAHGGRVCSFGIVVTLWIMAIVKYPCEEVRTVDGRVIVRLTLPNFG